ncbi:Reverse transcriptase zinc-binding domain [Sesbania bispinosa]|nr:Reverse transcriptase zinc-binding domain [Sesbania bispinosa]
MRNLGNGQDTRFWLDSFIPGLQPLISYAMVDIPSQQRNLPIACFASTGNWIHQNFNELLPKDIKLRINAVSAPRDNLFPDAPTWAASFDGEFSMKSAYERHHRGMTQDSFCLRCQDSPETIMHILEDCPLVMETWNSVINDEQWATFFSLGLESWLRFNLEEDRVGCNVGISWSLFFLSIYGIFVMIEIV